MSAQLDAWRGPMGDNYTRRQTLTVEARRAMFARILPSMPELPRSVIEFGANVGDNLVAIRSVLRDIITIGVEPNRQACAEMARRDEVTLARNHSMTASGADFGQHDLAFTRGVLIHIHPHDLALAYDALHRSAKRYVLVAEYYAPRPTEIPYHGQLGLLWKRDFAGEMLDRYKGLRLIDYGFVYHRDPQYPQDDVTWFLMEKP